MTAPYLPPEEKVESTADKVVAGFKEIGRTTFIWGVLFIIFAIIAAIDGDKEGQRNMMLWAFPSLATWALIANFVRGYEKK